MRTPCEPLPEPVPKVSFGQIWFSFFLLKVSMSSHMVGFVGRSWWEEDGRGACGSHSSASQKPAVTRHSQHGHSGPARPSSATRSRWLTQAHTWSRGMGLARGGLMERPKPLGEWLSLHGQGPTFPAPARIPALSAQLELGAEGRGGGPACCLQGSSDWGKWQKHPEPTHSKGACWHPLSQSPSLLGPNPA